MTSVSLEDCAEYFLQCHYDFHSFPVVLMSDNGFDWVGGFWKSSCKVTGMEQRLSIVFHPEMAG